MMIPDPTEEIKAIRHRLGEDFNFDLERIFADIQRRQSESGRTYVTMPPRKSEELKALHPSSGVALSVDGISTPTAG
jgi:hypothetical protein